MAYLQRYVHYKIDMQDLVFCKKNTDICKKSLDFSQCLSFFGYENIKVSENAYKIFIFMLQKVEICTKKFYTYSIET